MHNLICRSGSCTEQLRQTASLGTQTCNCRAQCCRLCYLLSSCRPDLQNGPNHQSLLLLAFIFQAIGFLLNTDTHFSSALLHTAAHIHAWELRCTHRLHPNITGQFHMSSSTCSRAGPTLLKGKVLLFKFNARGFSTSVCLVLKTFNASSFSCAKCNHSFQSTLFLHKYSVQIIKIFIKITVQWSSTCTV